MDKRSKRKLFKKIKKEIEKQVSKHVDKSVKTYEEQVKQDTIKREHKKQAHTW